MKFDALLLIDCWGEEWIKTNGFPNTREFYGRVLDFVDKFEYDKVFFCSNPEKTHHWFENFYSDHIYIEKLHKLTSPSLTNRLKPGSTLLVGGAAWQFCLHYKAEINFHSLSTLYQVYSHPNIVDSHMHKKEKITSTHFFNDSLPWVEKQDLFFLPCTSSKI